MTKIDLTAEDLGLTLSNRPSQREGSHTAGEWRKHLAETESMEIQREVRGTRQKLGKFTLRFMVEAVYGDDMAKQILGESGGDILMEDVALDPNVIKKLVEEMGGENAKAKARKLPAGRGDVPSREVLVEDNKVNLSPEAQTELLRFLLKNVNAGVLKRLLAERS